MINILLLIMLVTRAFENSDSVVYSPVQDIVEYEIKRFNTGFLDEPETVFQGPPTDAMDEAWSDLYERGVSYLLPDEANRLVDRTIRAPGSNVYIGGLDVFHQLHCLDMIRMAAYPQRYPPGHHTNNIFDTASTAFANRSCVLPTSASICFITLEMRLAHSPDSINSILAETLTSSGIGRSVEQQLCGGSRCLYTITVAYHEPVIFYKLVKFHTGFFEDEVPSVFDGPSTDSMDAAWTDLYDIYTYAISSLTTEENGQLADPTVPAFGNTSQLYGGLDVFHQLHCLDYVRKALEPERYGGVDGRRASSMNKRKATADLPHVSTAEHVSHCLDMIRQSLMCSADISVISWYMPIPSSAEHTPNPLPRFDQTRMCRDFDRLRDWARSRTPDAEGLEGVMPHGHGAGH
ncbi:hypothetical protein EYR36_003230 [Pleurotus pulmonarius]|nr:hypothetical protein EYR36_003230 [Pleurotus pulmonarius]